MTGKQLKEFLEGLTEEQLELEVMFDTEGRTFDYHMARIDSVYCEDRKEVGLEHIGLVEEYWNR